MIALLKMFTRLKTILMTVLRIKAIFCWYNKIVKTCQVYSFRQLSYFTLNCERRDLKNLFPSHSLLTFDSGSHSFL